MHYYIIVANSEGVGKKEGYGGKAEPYYFAHPTEVCSMVTNGG